MPTPKYIKPLLLLGFILLALAHTQLCFLSFYNNDDVNYARYAANLVKNGWDYTLPNTHFQLRWLPIFITAIFYKLFGISVTTSLLSNFLSLTGVACIMYAIQKQASTLSLFFTFVCYFFTHNILFNMHRLLPDAIMCFCIVLLYFIYQNITHQPKQNNYKNGIGFGVVAFAAVITKETVVIAFPLFFIFLLKDFFSKKNIQFWLISIASFTLLLLAYLAYFYITTGHAFYRYNLLQQCSYYSLCSYDLLPFTETLKRIGYLLFEAQLRQGEFLITIPAIAGCFYASSLNIKKIEVYSFIGLWLLSNFMTISFSHYVPLCHDTRHFMFVLPLAAIIAGKFLAAYSSQNAKSYWVLPVLYTLATAIMFALPTGSTKYLYAAMAAVTTIKLLTDMVGIKPRVPILFTLGFAAIMSINFIVDIKSNYAATHTFFEQKQLLQQHFLKVQKPITVYVADTLDAEINEYMLNFNTNHISFKTIANFSTNNKEANKFILLSNPAQYKVFLDSVNKQNTLTTVTTKGHTVLYKW